MFRPGRGCGGTKETGGLDGKYWSEFYRCPSEKEKIYFIQSYLPSCYGRFLKPVQIENLNKIGYIFCGTSVELFRALAAMNDENDREQWFVEEGRMFKCNSKKLNNYSYHALYTRKATAEEIIEYFKEKWRYSRKTSK